MHQICPGKMKNKTVALLLLLFSVLMSIPWLVPHTGWVALFAIVPLLCAERIASFAGVRRFFLWYYPAFILWNAVTTFWIWNATAGGAVFAILINAALFSLIFALFRFSRRHFGGPLPYIFLMVAWIAWERFYFSAEISWPWLTLGNAFARTTRLVQWYSLTGTLGGSLWIWCVNLGIFGLMTSLSDGSWNRWNAKARTASLVGILLSIAFPAAASLVMYGRYEEKSERRIDVLVGQPDFDPYHKFESMTQDEQNSVLLSLFDKSGTDPDLFIAPETFTSDVILGDAGYGHTWARFVSFLQEHPSSEILFGASAWKFYSQRSQPSFYARPYGTGWTESYNSALLVDADGRTGVCNKGRLVIGTELMPYPRIVGKLDDMLGGVCGRCVPQDKPTCLYLSDGTPFGCAICYESVFGEYCTEYVRQGAEFLAVITNDAWWGDTPGYVQHLSYARLRAIELRRDVARCANTGISAFIDQRGDIVSQTGWWVADTLEGEVNLSTGVTAFVKYGDITGRVCTLVFVLMLLALVVRTVSGASRQGLA